MTNRSRLKKVAIAAIVGTLGLFALAWADALPLFFNGFEIDTSGWHVFEQFGASQFVPTRVASGTHGITSKTGAFHAEVPGPFDLDNAGGSAATNWGGYGFSFPSGGYSTRVDVYLDVATSAANDTRFDFSSAIAMPGPGTCNVGHCSVSNAPCWDPGTGDNCPAGQTCNRDTCTGDAGCFAAPQFQFCKPPFRRDFVFNAGFYTAPQSNGTFTDTAGSNPHYIISASNNAGRSGAFPANAGRDPIIITQTGWYTLEHTFYDSGGGVLAVQLEILDASGNVVHTWAPLSDPSDIIGSTVGGNRYGWFAANEFPFLAVDNSRRAFTCGARSVKTTGSDAGNDCLDSSAPCLTIQHAIDVACAGDTVNVAAGTYPESPNVTKALTLQGAGQTSTFIELQTGPTYLGSLTIGDVAGGDTTVNGFTFVGRDAPVNGLAGTDVLVNPQQGHVVISNNTFRVGAIDPNGSNGDDGMGVLTTFDTSHSVTSVNVTDNTFQPLNTAAGRAFYINPGVTSFLFQGNTITGEFDGRAITQANSSLVESNTVVGTGTPGSRSAGFGVWGDPNPAVYGHATFQSNTVTGTHKAFSIIESNNVVITCNRIAQNDNGVVVEVFNNDPFDVTTDVVHTNSIEGNTLGVGNIKPAALDATTNWWGCPTGPNTGSCDTTSGNVTSSPFATSVPSCLVSNSLHLTKARLNPSANGLTPNGSITATGDFLTHPPGDTFGVASGLGVEVQDGLHVNQTFEFAASDCVTAATGRIRCRKKTGGMKLAATFRPVSRAAQQFVFSLRFTGLVIQSPLLLPVTLDVAQGTVGSGSDRVGSISACAVSPNGKMTCRQP